MKKRILSMLLALLTLFSLCVPALAAAGPADEPAPIARTVSPSTPSAAVRKAAQTVFDEYYDAYYNGRVVERLRDVMAMNDYYGGRDYWYTFYDLDKNGSAELFICSALSGGEYDIVDMYEFVGGKAVRTFEADELGYRTYMLLLSDGRFKLDYVAMGNGSVAYYQLSKNGKLAKLVGGYLVDFAHKTYSDIITHKPITEAQAGKMDNGAQELRLTGWTKFLSSGVKKNGLNTENGKTYYYKNNIRQTGLLTIDGYTYCFSASDGHMFKSTVVNTGSGKLRYFDKQGHMLKACWVNGGVNKRYYAGADGVLYSGLKVIGGKTYYFSTKNGAMLKGLVTTDSKGTQRYFSTRDGHMMKSGWIYVNGRPRYYANASGVITQKR